MKPPAPFGSTGRIASDVERPRSDQQHGATLARPTRRTRTNYRDPVLAALHLGGLDGTWVRRRAGSRVDDPDDLNDSLLVARGMLKQVVVTSAAAVALSATVAFASPAAAVDTPIEVDRTSVAFGEVEIGTTATATLTLTNTGTSNFGPINMFGGAPFTLQYGASQNCQAMVLPPGATCQLTYTFTPDGNGPFTDTSNFTISPTGSQSEGEDFLIPLTGTGCQGPACTGASEAGPPGPGGPPTGPGF